MDKNKCGVMICPTQYATKNMTLAVAFLVNPAILLAIRLIHMIRVTVLTSKTSEY